MMPWRCWDWTDWLLWLCFGLTLALLVVGGVVLLVHDAHLLRVAVPRRRSYLEVTHAAFYDDRQRTPTPQP